MNIKMVDFALLSLKRRVWKNISVFFIFTLLIAFVFSLFLIAGSIKRELALTLHDLPDIFVQKTRAGRLVPIEEERVYAIASIDGVKSVYPRIWGYYYYKNAGVNFSIVGIDFDMPSFSSALNKLLPSFQPPKAPFMIVGKKVKDILEKNYYKEYFNFIKPDGDFVKVRIAGVFDPKSELESADTIVMPIELARELFDMNEEKVTDIMVSVYNPKEIPTIAQKIRLLYPDTRVITKEDLKASYQNIFDYKSGLFLALFLAAFFAFFILVFEKASSVGREQVREIGILKALGWKIEDVLRLKFLESFLVIFFSFFLGIVLSYFFVYFLQAPLLRNIFSGFSVLKPTFELVPVWDWSLFISTLLIMAPLYLAATIIPSWRASVIDPEEALR